MEFGLEYLGQYQYKSYMGIMTKSVMTSLLTYAKAERENQTDNVPMDAFNLSLIYALFKTIMKYIQHRLILWLSFIRLIIDQQQNPMVMGSAK